jgi:hypothetical protein
MGVKIQLFEGYAWKALQSYEGKSNDVFIAFTGYVNDLNKLQQFKVSVKKTPPSTSMHFSTLLAIVRVAHLRSSWRSCFMRAALFIMRATNSSLVVTYSSLFIHPHIQKSKGVISGDFKLQTALSSHPLKIGHMFIWTYLLRIFHTTTY